jgi:signal transduction histidine kinase
MANRPVPENKKAKAAGISLPPQLINQARKHAYQRGMSLSGFVRHLLIEKLEKEAAKADVERQKIQLQAQTLAEKQRQARDDEFASIEDRIKANEELGKILEQQYKDESAQISKKVAFAQAQHDLNATTENYVALQQALLEETDLLERLEGQRSEQKMNYISLLREQRDIERSNTDAYLEQLEKQYHEQMEKINQSKLEFFINISHEIRTPLTLILCSIEKLISNFKLNPKQEKEALTIDKNVNNLLELTNELLAIHKMETGNYQLKVQKNDMITFLKNIKTIFKSLAKSKEIKISIDTYEPELFVWFDKTTKNRPVYPMEAFVTLDQWRELQLNKLI